MRAGEGRIFQGKDCGARGTAGCRAREGGGAGADCAKSTRKLRDLLPCVLASWEGSRRERNREMSRARRGGAGADCAQSTRKLCDLLPRVLASWEGSRREWNREMSRARRGRGRRGLRAIDPAARERPRIRASFNRKNEKMEPVGTVARRVRCRFGVLIFQQCLRCGHAFSTQPRWLKRSVMSCVATAALADAAQPYWLKPFSDEQPSTQLR